MAKKPNIVSATPRNPGFSLGAAPTHTLAINSATNDVNSQLDQAQSLSGKAATKSVMLEAMSSVKSPGVNTRSSLDERNTAAATTKSLKS